MMVDKCIFCGKSISKFSEDRFVLFDCSRCGKYKYKLIDAPFVNGSIDNVNKTQDELEKKKFNVYCSYLINKHNYNNDYFIISISFIENAIKNSKFLDIKEQADAFIYYICSYMKYPTFNTKITSFFDDFYPRFGCIDRNSFLFLDNYLVELGYMRSSMIKSVEREGVPREFEFSIKEKAWEHYAELKRGNNATNKAFLALQFNGELNQSFKDRLKEAVSETGFVLNTVDEEPRAGLIDDKIRLDIRNSRFVIADLTDGNKGAYWEAGFANGLGKEVIYMCKDEVMNNETSPNNPHFDVSHHQCILWSEDHFENAVKKLKDTIRYTFPDAIQED